jgi:hypothetical protein
MPDDAQVAAGRKPSGGAWKWLIPKVMLARRDGRWATWALRLVQLIIKPLILYTRLQSKIVVFKGCRNEANRPRPTRMLVAAVEP